MAITAVTEYQCTHLLFLFQGLKPAISPTRVDSAALEASKMAYTLEASHLVMENPPFLNIF